jgi:polygalacturonase
MYLRKKLKNNFFEPVFLLFHYKRETVRFSGQLPERNGLNMTLHIITISSLEKVFWDEPLNTVEWKSGSALRGERYSFQIASNPDADFYDDTHCEDILIEECTFDKSGKYPAPINGIGTHTQTASTNKHKNIRIKNNDAVGRGLFENYGYFLSLANMKDVIVEGNNISKYTRFGRIYAFDSAYETDGSKVDSTDGTQGGCENVTFRDNTERNVMGSFVTYGIYTCSKSAARHKDIKLINNTFELGNVNTAGKYAGDIQSTDGVLFERNKAYGRADVPTAFRDINCTDVQYI